jgi:hypothetical protein
MYELTLLAIVSLASMGLLVFLFLRLTAQQTKLIEFLTTTNQSLLNQVRSKDLATLSGLEQVYSGPVEDAYLSTDDRELIAWQQAVAAQHQLGDVLDEEDIETFKAAL